METRDIFEEMAGRYDTEERRKNAGIIADEIRRELKNTRGKAALDYGCGTGLVGLSLVDLFGSMLLVDTAPQMVAQVERKISSLGLTTATARCLDLLTQSPGDVKADYILLSQVLLHVKDYPLLLTRLYRVLNPEGTLVIVDFDENDRIVSDLVHPGFVQSVLAETLKQIGFTSAEAHTFHHGEKMFMHQDASLFLLKAGK